MTYRPNLQPQLATLIQPGAVRPDGSTISVTSDATVSVVGAAVTALTDVSSGTLGGPAASDIDTLNRAGTDYKVTLSARASFFRKTPAGSRTIALVADGVGAILTSGDNDRQVVVTGSSGVLSGDGSISDGFSCLIVNKSGGPLSYSGISAPGGSSSLPIGSVAQVYMAASVLEIVPFGANTALQPASTSVLGGVKPDGVSITAASDGTLSVISTATHALPAGASINSLDELAAFSTASSSDVKYSFAQLGAYVLSYAQSWTAALRPVLTSTQYSIGFNTTLNRFEFWNGSVWHQHVRISDLSGTASQLFGGTGTSGVAVALNIGPGLQLVGGALCATPITTPAVNVVASGTAQALSFPTSGNRAYDITLTADCTFTISGGTSGELQTLTLVLRGGAGGFGTSLPSNVKWKGGSPPAVDTSAGSIFIVRIQTCDGGNTYAGNF